MNPLDSVQDNLRITALAKRRAQVLRRQAVADFWRDADAAWTVTQAWAGRSAQRLAYALARHAQGRREAARSAPSVEHQEV